MTTDTTRSSNPAEDTGTPEAEWRRWPELGQLPHLDLRGVREAAVVAPHPDDETLGFGGGLALLAANGVRLRIIAVTDGEASHPGSTVFTGDQLVVRRAAERANALAALGAADAEVVRLGLPDSGVGEWETALADRLPDLCGDADVCVAPWEGDPHPDHEAVGRAAADCARTRGTRLLSYPVWTWHWSSPGDASVPWARARRLGLSRDARCRKDAAILCFGTQISPIGPEASDRVVLEPSMLAHFARDFEVVFA
ncbi:PIG-L family deacetylase [Nocardiopsis gilva YIM 90087]|uniref:PIG-L family deacetylase n=1 Tax=Nocardiopsis gilva YIM 90087 TaxID=1235441 RepID=A0A223SBE8_9ACTN|nr:PIG-L family deacetylase [Nocardiopsis gilva]ASU85430.1 PIG-L family deacetylase [Nocardiopsis gilva YIM 90087]